MEFIQVTSPEALQLVSDTASQVIQGYGRLDAAAYRSGLQASINTLFDDPTEAPDASITYAAVEPTGGLYGAAIVEVPHYAELQKTNPENAKSLAEFHRTLAALFVAPTMRRSGLGSQLMSIVTETTLRQGARWVEGFVDDRNGSADFYRTNATRVQAHNTGLPARWPAQTRMTHPPGLHGHWFHYDLWELYGDQMQCSHCQGHLKFVPDDGGRLRCAACQIG